MRVRSLLVFAPLALATGCASSGARQAAERGDWPAVQRELARELKDGRLDGAEARDVAEAVAKREVRTAKDGEAVDRVEAVWPCAEQVEDALEERARGTDAASSRAAFLLVDDRLASTSRWVGRANDPDAGWRAVGARSLVHDGDGDARRKLFLDVDARVRRGAFDAAFDAQDEADASGLLETVRLDPDGLAKYLATKAVGGIGGRTVVLALRDRWNGADDSIRAAIAYAWGYEKSFDAGGRDELMWAAQNEAGQASITAARTLLRGTPEEATTGRGALVRAIDQGPSAQRVTAIRVSPPTDADLRAAIERAATSGDLAVKVAALGQLALLPDHRRAALDELGPIAAGSSAQANSARQALADQRDRRVVPLLEDEQKDQLPGIRSFASRTLAGMHELAFAAQTLGDQDGAVRTATACAILAAPKH